MFVIKTASFIHLRAVAVVISNDQTNG
jgi:hypothetical protein